MEELSMFGAIIVLSICVGATSALITVEGIKDDCLTEGRFTADSHEFKCEMVKP